jgi:hypothetical protein
MGNVYSDQLNTEAEVQAIQAAEVKTAEMEAEADEKRLEIVIKELYEESDRRSETPTPPPPQNFEDPLAPTIFDSEEYVREYENGFIQAEQSAEQLMRAIDMFGNPENNPLHEIDNDIIVGLGGVPYDISDVEYIQHWASGEYHSD